MNDPNPRIDAAQPFALLVLHDRITGQPGCAIKGTDGKWRNARVCPFKHEREAARWLNSWGSDRDARTSAQVVEWLKEESSYLENVVIYDHIDYQAAELERSGAAPAPPAGAVEALVRAARETCEAYESDDPQVFLDATGKLEQALAPFQAGEAGNE